MKSDGCCREFVQPLLHKIIVIDPSKRVHYQQEFIFDKIPVSLLFKTILFSFCTISFDICENLFWQPSHKLLYALEYLLRNTMKSCCLSNSIYKRASVLDSVRLLINLIITSGDGYRLTRHKKLSFINSL